MSAEKGSTSKLFVSIAFFCTVLIPSAVLYSQQTKSTISGKPSMRVVDDWSHHHMVYSNPGTMADALANGTFEKWLRITNDPRYQMQVLKRSTTQQSVAAAPDFTARMAVSNATGPGASSIPKRGAKGKLKKDWSTPLGSSAFASQFGTFTTSSGTGTVVVDGVTFTASPGTAATGSITVGSSFCFPQGANVIVDGITFTTSATAGTGAVTIAANAHQGDTVTIGGTTYTFVTSTMPGTNQVHISTTTAQNTALDLQAAINGACTATACGTGTTANISVSAGTPSGGSITLTALCANNSTLTVSTSSGGRVTVASVGVGSPGSNSTTTFALGTNVATATNIYSDITGNTALSAALTATNSSGAIDLTAATGLAGNSYTLSTTATSGVTLVAFTGGSAGTTSGLTFSTSTDANPVTTPVTNLDNEATALASVINTNATTSVAVTASTDGPSVIVTANAPGPSSIALTGTVNSTFSWAGPDLVGGATATVQPNMFPAKYGASATTADCAGDFVVYPTGAFGGDSSANIIGYSNLYAGCGGTVPTVAWAFNTGYGAMVTTSPIVGNSTQVVFIQSDGTTASLVLLKVAPGYGTLDTPVTLANEVSGSAFQTCTAPCMYTIPFGNGANDSNSAPFFDYSGTDNLYVGDDAGNLHMFTGVYAGSPAEAGSPWPVSLGTAELSSPIFDVVSGYVFVGDMAGTLHSVIASSGVAQGSVMLGDAIADAPLVDGSAGSLYVFVTSATVNKAGNNAVYEFPVGFTGSITGGFTMGAGGTGYYLYAGTFDNVYYQSSNATGNLYTVANTGATTGANLYRIAIASNAMTGVTAPVTGLTFSGASPFPSGVSEFCNNGASACTASGVATTAGTDYIFFSVNRGSETGCINTAGHGCVLSYTVNSPSTIAQAGSGLTVYTPGTNGCWATSGIVVDNSDTTTSGASQIYFVNLNGSAAGGPFGSSTVPTSSNCTPGSATNIYAVQASQSNP